MTESTRTYPYTAWCLTNTCRPKAVELVREYKYDRKWDFDRTGRGFDTRKLYPTRDEAIVAARIKIAERRARLMKMDEAALNKLEAA